MLGRVDAHARHAAGVEVVQVGGHSGSHGIVLMVQVHQPHQVALLHLQQQHSSTATQQRS
jgi:hypothetical protein